MSEDWQSERVKTTHRLRRVIIYVAVLLLAFLLGFVPMWVKSRECSSSLADAERQLNVTRMENTLASAAIEARRGDYETARQSASDFFTAMLTELNRGADSALSQAAIEGIQPLLTERDQIITLLARGDPAAADRLSDLYGSYREIVK